MWKRIGVKRYVGEFIPKPLTGEILPKPRNVIVKIFDKEGAGFGSFKSLV